jgi:hypothetical protein
MTRHTIVQKAGTQADIEELEGQDVISVYFTSSSGQDYEVVLEAEPFRVPHRSPLLVGLYTAAVIAITVIGYSIALGAL